MTKVIAVDLGAESGRVATVEFDGTRFFVEEIHRFANGPVTLRGTMFWNILHLWQEISAGIEKAKESAASIGVATWGVDFALLDRDDNLVANPVHYRDMRTEGMMEWVFERIPRREVFERTGIQFLTLNTLYQYSSILRRSPTQLEAARYFLMMPDLINFWLTGEKVSEFTDATTTQFYNPLLGDWDRQMLNRLGLPTHILPTIVQPGTRIGAYQGVPVHAPACHDTGSAVVAIPATSPGFAYLSSGTWSLLGLELPKPVITDETYAANVTNEGGVEGTFRLLQNIMGLWLAQQCRATWRAAGTEYTYDELARLASEAEPFRSLIFPDDPNFMLPGDMPSRIRDYCARTDQPIPETVAQVMRTIYESLALKYRYALDHLIRISGQTINRMHIVGGGSKNALLCQMTADAIGREVVAGPAEGTVLGNAIVQLIAVGALTNVAQARRVLASTIDAVSYQPKHREDWEGAYERFRRLVPEASQ
ncbi:MAG: rhamnulokinase [Anaerolineae bacterium]|nr:rhamnulokinase [Anaerolineae bacterium]NUQ04359.1 rhamnulokinase [Anaerolineae bacterium]